MQDAVRYQRACNRKAVMRWLGGIQTTTQVREDVAYFIASEARDGFTFWLVERVSDNKLLGFVGLVRIPDDDCPFRGQVEVGWRLRKNAWRKGYGTEAAFAVLDHAFSKLALDRIVSRTAKGNTASKALMRKLGLKRRRDLDYRPVASTKKFAVFAITAAQWHAWRTPLSHSL